MAIDLHTHTTFSDGTFTPQQLVDLALKTKLKAIAITDHDEIAANKLATQYAVQLPIEVISGCEFSIDYPLSGSAHLHLLGLFLDYNNTALVETLADLKKARAERAYIMLDKLKKLGYNIAKERLDAIVGDGTAGRPHIARLMVEEGVVTNVFDAFTNYMAREQPLYVGKKKLTLAAAMELIHQANGLAILAHPVSLKMKTYRDLEKKLKLFKEMGLDGVEAYHSSHTWNFTKYLINAGHRLGLAISGGSDFHGSVKPDTALGTGKGKLYIPDSILDQLKERL